MADFEKKLGYTAGGADPEDIKAKGFQAGYKPPASYFNWLFTRISECIDELQAFGSKLNIDIQDISAVLKNKLDKEAIVIHAGDDLNFYYNRTDIGMYVYSMADSSTIGNVPEIAHSTMLILPRIASDDENNLVQVVLTQTDNLYVRNLVDGFWSEWVKFFKNDDIIPLENGGTGAKTVKDARNVFNLPETCVTITDWNTAIKSGWYMGNNTQNSPSEGWHFGFVLAHNENYVFQEIYRFSQTHSKPTEVDKFIRSKHNGNWTDWAKVTVQRTVLESAKLEYITTLRGNAQDQLDNKLNLKPGYIELVPNSTAGYGGYFDFHYNGSEEDYTTRIIESKAGSLQILSTILKIGSLGFNSGNGLIESDDNCIALKAINEDGTAATRLFINYVDEDQKASALTLSGNEGTSYKVFGEHNKPTGFYTGSNTIRTTTTNPIYTGGVGKVLLIWCSDFVTIITPTGGFTMGTQNTINDGAYYHDEVKYVNGYLVISKIFDETTAKDRLGGINKSGTTYYYQCL